MFERIHRSHISAFVPLVESGICLLVDVATLSTIYDVRHPLLLPPGYPTQELFSRPQAVFFRYSYPSSSLRCSLVASARLCCLSRVPPAVCPSLLESATTVCTFFLQSLLRTYIRRRLIPYYDSGPLHKHQIYVRPIFHTWYVEISIFQGHHAQKRQTPTS